MPVFTTMHANNWIHNIIKLVESSDNHIYAINTATTNMSYSMNLSSYYFKTLNIAKDIVNPFMQYYDVFDLTLT